MTRQLQGEGQIERGVNLVVIHLAVSGMEMKIERVLMLEITVHLSRTPATRDIKDFFQNEKALRKSSTLWYRHNWEYNSLQFSVL